MNLEIMSHTRARCKLRISPSQSEALRLQREQDERVAQQQREDEESHRRLMKVTWRGDMAMLVW